MNRQVGGENPLTHVQQPAVQPNKSVLTRASESLISLKNSASNEIRNGIDSLAKRVDSAVKFITTVYNVWSKDPSKTTEENFKAIVLKNILDKAKANGSQKTNNNSELPKGLEQATNKLLLGNVSNEELLNHKNINDNLHDLHNISKELDTLGDQLNKQAGTHHNSTDDYLMSAELDRAFEKIEKAEIQNLARQQHEATQEQLKNLAQKFNPNVQQQPAENNKPAAEAPLQNTHSAKADAQNPAPLQKETVDGKSGTVELTKEQIQKKQEEKFQLLTIGSKIDTLLGSNNKISKDEVGSILKDLGKTSESQNRETLRESVKLLERLKANDSVRKAIKDSPELQEGVKSVTAQLQTKEPSKVLLESYALKTTVDKILTDNKKLRINDEKEFVTKDRSVISSLTARHAGTSDKSEKSMEILLARIKKLAEPNEKLNIEDNLEFKYAAGVYLKTLSTTAWGEKAIRKNDLDAMLTSDQEVVFKNNLNELKSNLNENSQLEVSLREGLIKELKPKTGTEWDICSKIIVDKQSIKSGATKPPESMISEYNQKMSDAKLSKEFIAKVNVEIKKFEKEFESAAPLREENRKKAEANQAKIKLAEAEARKNETPEQTRIRENNERIADNSNNIFSNYKNNIPILTDGKLKFVSPQTPNISEADIKNGMNELIIQIKDMDSAANKKLVLNAMKEQKILEKALPQGFIAKELENIEMEQLAQPKQALRNVEIKENNIIKYFESIEKMPTIFNDSDKEINDLKKRVNNELTNGKNLQNEINGFARFDQVTEDFAKRILPNVKLFEVGVGPLHQKMVEDIVKGKSGPEVEEFKRLGKIIFNNMNLPDPATPIDISKELTEFTKLAQEIKAKA